MIELNLTAILSILNFLLLFFVLKKVLFDKFFDIIEQRKAKIKGEIAQAEELRKDANALKIEYSTKIEEAKESSQELITRAEREAEEILRQAREKAHQEIQRMHESAEIRLNQEREKALEDIKGTIVASAVMLVGRFLKEEMDENAQKRYASRMLKSMEEK